MTRSCRDCGATIEAIPGVGWADVRSGDDGGTYDICPERFDAQHPDAPHGHRANTD